MGFRALSPNPKPQTPNPKPLNPNPKPSPTTLTPFRLAFQMPQQSLAEDGDMNTLKSGFRVEGLVNS